MRDILKEDFIKLTQTIEEGLGKVGKIKTENERVYVFCNDKKLGEVLVYENNPHLFFRTISLNAENEKDFNFTGYRGSRRMILWLRNQKHFLIDGIKEPQDPSESNLEKPKKHEEKTNQLSKKNAKYIPISADAAIKNGELKAKEVTPVMVPVFKSRKGKKKLKPTDKHLTWEGPYESELIRGVFVFPQKLKKIIESSALKIVELPKPLVTSKSKNLETKKNNSKKGQYFNKPLKIKLEAKSENNSKDSFNKEALQEKSLLIKNGYTVRAAAGLTNFQRQQILKRIIDQKILTKIQITNYLKFFIRRESNRTQIYNAVGK